MYIQKNLIRGYNSYIDAELDDHGTQMDIGMLVLEEGDSFEIFEQEKECAVLLFEGAITFEYAGKTVTGNRPDCFNYEAFCLLAPRRTAIKLTASSHSEIYIQKTVCENDYEPVMYTPDNVQVQHAGDKGELKGCMRREIKTFFDYENAPFSNMVLGEVLNFPGKWSSYPPHHHPQPEVYFYRFDYPQGFGAGFANGEVHKTGHNGMMVINEGFHSQCAAPGYAMCYAWGIRHLINNPWEKTRIDDKEHSWLWEANANDGIFSGE